MRLTRGVGSVRKVAKNLDLTATALRHWVKQADVDEGNGPERGSQYASDRYRSLFAERGIGVSMSRRGGLLRQRGGRELLRGP